MTALHKGFLAAGALHGALISAFIAYTWVGNTYRTSLKLDFTLTAAGGEHAGSETFSEASADEPTENNASETSTTTTGEANTPSKSTAQSSGAAAGGGEAYVKQNFAGVSGLIHAQLYYPRIARQNGWQGAVTINFWVMADGSVRNVGVRQSSGHRVLDESALEAVRSLTHLPPPPIPVLLTVPVQFRLR